MGPRSSVCYARLPSVASTAGLFDIAAGTGYAASCALPAAALDEDFCDEVAIHVFTTNGARFNMLLLEYCSIVGHSSSVCYARLPTSSVGSTTGPFDIAAGTSYAASCALSARRQLL